MEDTAICYPYKAGTQTDYREHTQVWPVKCTQVVPVFTFGVFCTLSQTAGLMYLYTRETLMTDIVDTHGETQELIQILNGFGLIASANTQD